MKSNYGLGRSYWKKRKIQSREKRVPNRKTVDMRLQKVDADKGGQCSIERAMAD